MQHISDPLLENLLELIGILEARELNRRDIREALDRGGYDLWPGLKKELERRTAGPTPCINVSAIPTGISKASEALGRLRRLHSIGCPREDVEGAIGFLIGVLQLPYQEAANFIFGEGSTLNVR